MKHFVYVLKVGKHFCLVQQHDASYSFRLYYTIHHFIQEYIVHWNGWALTHFSSTTFITVVRISKDKYVSQDIKVCCFACYNRKMRCLIEAVWKREQNKMSLKCIIIFRSVFDFFFIFQNSLAGVLWTFSFLSSSSCVEVWIWHGRILLKRFTNRTILMKNQMNNKAKKNVTYRELKGEGLRG